MKKVLSVVVVLFFITGALFSKGTKEEATDNSSLTVYAYDTFCGSWGPGPEVIPLFEEKTGIKVNLVSAGDAIAMLSRVKLEGDKCPADVILGITDDAFYLAENLFDSYEPSYISELDENILFDNSYSLLPFDYGDFAFVWDSQSNITPPKSLMDLTKNEYKGKVILIDPRTSSVGMGLLMWTYNVLGDDWITWWEKMKDNALTIASGWSSAYGLFSEGEAPIVISYTTSPVYHVMNEDTTRYQTLIFDEGHEATIEGIGILKTSKNKDQAREFVDFILTDAQEQIAVLNSMYPANSATSLPSAYSYAPKPNTIYTSTNLSQEKKNDLLAKWTEVMTK